MRRKGFSDKTSEAIADEALRNRELLGKIIAEEYGLKEKALENLQKLVYILVHSILLVSCSINTLFPIITSSAIMLGITGFLIAVSAGLSIEWKMLELICAGLGSAVLTYGIGRIASILLGIEVE